MNCLIYYNPIGHFKVGSEKICSVYFFGCFFLSPCFVHFKVKKYSFSFSHAKSNKSRKCLMHKILWFFLPEGAHLVRKCIFHLNGESRIFSYLSDCQWLSMSSNLDCEEYSLLNLAFNWVSTVKIDPFSYVRWFELYSYRFFSYLGLAHSVHHFRLEFKAFQSSTILKIVKSMKRISRIIAFSYVRPFYLFYIWGRNELENWRAHTNGQQNVWSYWFDENKKSSWELCYCLLTL